MTCVFGGDCKGAAVVGSGCKLLLVIWYTGNVSSVDDGKIIIADRSNV